MFRRVVYRIAIAAVLFSVVGVVFATQSFGTSGPVAVANDASGPIHSPAEYAVLAVLLGGVAVMLVWPRRREPAAETARKG